MEKRARAKAIRRKFFTIFMLVLFLHSVIWSVSLSDILNKEPFTGLPEVISESGLPNVDPNTYSGVVLKVLRLRTQQWLGADWEHTVLLAYNEELSPTMDTALVMIGGDYKYDREVLQAVISVLQESDGLFVFLFDVPNQPLLGGLREDWLISETFERYFQTLDPTVPALVPMVRSVRKVMDWIENAFGIRKFVLSGASKRGWTTFLTAAVDERVKGIVPISFDFLNFPEQLRKQKEWYGAYSPEIAPYTEKDFPAKLEEDVGKELLKIVDPYQYIPTLTTPKICVVGTNDPYWHLFSWQNYFPELSGYKQMLYIPNKGHGVELLRPILAILALIDHVCCGTQLPEYQWKVDDRQIVVEWTPQQDYTVLAAYLWTARSSTMDFRRAKWAISPLPIPENQALAQIAEFELENVGAFVELLFETHEAGKAAKRRLYLSTPVFLFPKDSERSGGIEIPRP